MADLSTEHESGFCNECGWPVQSCVCGTDDENEPDEDEEAMYDCHGYFDIPGKAGIFLCGAVGSEDCDECPMHCWLGLNHRQIDRLEEIDE